MDDDDATFLLVDLPDEHGPRYALFKRISTPVRFGEDGIPDDALEWLFESRVVTRAARLLPEQARGLLDKGVTAALGNDVNP